MARSVIILIIIACITECSVIKNSNNLPSTETNNLKTKLESTKVRSELDDFELTNEEREAEKSLREILTKLKTVLNSLNQQAEDISIRSSKEHKFHVVSY